MAESPITDADRERARRATERALQRKPGEGQPLSEGFLDKMSSAHPQTEADLAKIRKRGE